MTEKHPNIEEKQPREVPEQPGTSTSTITAVSAKGKRLSIIKIEGDVSVPSQATPKDLRAFKDRPIECLEEAFQREYEIEREKIEPEYDDMTEEDITKEIEKMTPQQHALFKEIKDLLTVQGRLKGKISRMGHLIQTYVTGRFPGIPSDQVQEYVAEEQNLDKQDISRVPAEKIETLIQEHDRRIPHRQAVVQPGRKGISMSIDPYDDIKLYEVDQIEDKIVEMIVLTDEEPKKGEETETEKDKEKPEEAAQPEPKEQTKASTSMDEPAQVVVPDLVTKERAEEYMNTDPEQDDTVNISSTSTADYDHDEAEDIIDKIASCHTSLAKHYEDVNKIIPHMTKTQLALYLGKLPVMPMVKAKGRTVSKLYVPEEGVDPNFEYPVQGDSWEEKLKFMTEHIPAEKLLFAIAIGDHTLNQFSQAKTTLKYGFAKTGIQRALSHDPSH